MSADASPKLLETLERLLEMPATSLETALSEACDLIAAALHADKVDAFLHDPSRGSLVALGTSTQLLSARQRQAGLDVLQIANGGRVVWVFEHGETFVTGHLDDDPDELRSIKQGLGIRSKLGVPLEVGGVRRGVLMIASRTADKFDEHDVRFAEIVGRYLGLVAHRAELVQEIARVAAEDGKRAVAEELVTVLAHDLRNFLAPIALRLDLIGRRAEQDGRQVDAREASLARSGVTRLSNLISEILDIARIEQGVFELNLDVVELGELLDEIATVVSTPSSPVVTKVYEDLALKADPARLRQCLENLISNAVKYSPRGANVTVVARREYRDRGERIRVDVMDEGPGIPPELMPRIFERFVTDNHEGGLGLGLFLAKRIAVAHGGDLTVESAPGKGTRFTLCLPDGQDTNTTSTAYEAPTRSPDPVRH